MYFKPIPAILFLWVLLFFGSISSISDADLLNLAKHLSRTGNPDEAITEYKRFLFFHPDDVRAASIYREIAFAYRSQGLWQDAINTLLNAVQSAEDNEEKSEYQLDLAVTLIAVKNYDLAILETIKVILRTPSGPQYRRALFLQSIAYIYQFRWEEAREALKNYSSDESLNRYFDEAVNLTQKSPRTAKILSAILPGSGQIYAGDWKGGLNAFALNGVLGYVTVDSILDGLYVDALLWVYFIFQRYYQGNLYRAGKAAEDFNIHANHRTTDNILKQLKEVAEK